MRVAESVTMGGIDCLDMVSQTMWKLTEQPGSSMIEVVELAGDKALMESSEGLLG